ncbi:MAG: hypothetical protein ABJX46_00130, partial [Erythrobacter sp.]
MLGYRIANVKWILIGFFALVTGTAASAADLQVTQYAVDPDPIAASATGTFSVTVENNSGQSVNDPEIVISIPANYELIDAPGNFPAFCVVTGAVGSQTLTCTPPELVRGSPITIEFDAIAMTPGVENSTASISAPGNTDNNPGNDELTISTTVRGGADLSVAKSGSSPTVIAGGTLDYTLTVTNDGPNTTSDIRVTDNLPAGSDYDFSSATGTGWNCSLAGQVVTCVYSGAAPAPGANYPDITISGEVTSGTAGTISNIASVEITDPLVLDPDVTNNNSNQVVTNVNAGTDLEALKSMPSTIITGQTVNIDLTIRNTGPQSAPAGSTIVDTIDASLSIGTLPAGCTSSGQTVTCTAGALALSNTANFSIPVTAVAPTGGTINNTATVSPPAGFPDPTNSNNTAIAPFEVENPNADLQLRAKNKFPNPVAPGADVTSRIFVRNLGPSVASYSPANPLRITDTLSANETFSGINPATPDWSCTVASNVVTCETTGTGTIAVGSQVELRLTTIAGAGTDSNITNVACTDSTGGSAHTPSSNSPAGNDCISRSVRSTTSAADLSVQKDVSLSPASGFAENITIPDSTDVFYIRLRASNAAGGDTARTVRVRDTLPNFINETGFNTGVTLESTTKGTLSYSASIGRAQWNLTDLAAGETETIVLRVERPFEAGTYTNTADIFSTDTTELDSSNNNDTADYTVIAIADMTVNNKSVTPDPVRVGVPATYLISVRNDGANPADNVVVTDVIDPDFFEILGTPTTTKSGATCSVTAATGEVSCAMGQFVRTEVRQITVEVLPKYPFGGNLLGSFPVVYTNRATVETDTFDSDGGTDPNAGNNFFDLPHPVEGPDFDIGVTKRESNPATDDPVRFDETLNYDIRASNFGPSRATDVLILDIPAPPAGLTMTLSSVTINPVAANGGLTLQAAPNAGCVTAGANVECRVDTGNVTNNFLDAGNQVIFRVSFTMGGTPPSTVTTFANEVQITSAEHPVWDGTGADGLISNNRAVQNTTVLPSTDLEVLSKTRVGALERSVNEPVEYVVRFRNNGPSGSTSVRITDVLPAGFTFHSDDAPSTTIPGGSTAVVSAVSCSGTSTVTCDLEGTFPPGAGDSVDLSFYAVAPEPYSGAVAPTDLTNTVTITPGVDEFGDPVSEDAVDTNNSGSANTQIAPSSIAGSVYADDDDSGAFETGEGMGGVTVTLTGTDAFGNMITVVETTDASGAFSFDNLPPSDAAGYTIVETQVATHYDLNETAGSEGGTVDNSSYGDTAAENTISAIVLPVSTDATDYLFQNHINAVIVAEDDNPAAVVGATGGDDIINALTNDTFNGSPATTSTVAINITAPATPVNGGSVPVLDPLTGLVDVPAGTPADTYTIEYEICDIADPEMCDPAVITVVVTAAPIQAVNDTESDVNGATGAPDVLNVLADDTLNGVAADTTTVDIAVATGSSVPAGLTFDPLTGSVSVDPGTPAGPYSFDYTICEKLNPLNCSTATATVNVVAAPIQAVSESVTDINGASGEDDVLNALADDTLNGVPATTSNVTIEVAPMETVPAGLTFDTSTGNVSVDPGTPAGTYSFDYRICEILNPSNCAIATETVTVVAAPILAVNDSVSGINGTSGQDDVLNVLTDDTLNGSAADITTVDIAVATGSTVPAGLTFDPLTGNVSVDPGTPAGPYSFDYTICEKINPSNCSTATATVTVVAGPITADDDNAAPVNGSDGASGVIDALDGDTLDNNPTDVSEVAISVLAPATPINGGPVPVLNPATGLVDVPAGTPAGDYEIDYQICEILNPTNCADATITVPVTAAPIQAVNDTESDVNGATGAPDVLNVLTGDTLNGVDATTSNVTIAVATGSSVPAGLTFDPATGSVSVDPGTPAGPYSFDYTICEILNPSNCSTATATVNVVAAPIEAVDDSQGDVNGASGAGDVLSALDGDTLNGAPATLANVTIALAPGASVPAELSFDPATGLTSVNPGTPAGDYSFDYQICEILNPTNCAIATETVTVIAAPIDAQPDTAAPTNGGTGAPGVIDVLPNDTLNGDPVTLDTIDITVATPATPINGGPVPTLDPATGLVDVPAGTPAGDYVIEYTICEELNPTNCATTSITVPVTAGPIEAVDDSVSDINGADGADDVLNVLTGDTINGAPATIDNVTISVAPGSEVPAGLTFDPATGSVSVEPGTPAGDYSFEYQICEILNPTNCTTATATVTVIASPIEANDDTQGDIDSRDGADNVVNAFDGDTINGQPASPDNAILSIAPGSSLPAGITFDPATGAVGVEPGTPEGTYTFDYQLCERLNPTNCTTATITLTVIPTLSAVNGVVYLDENMNRTFESDEDLQDGWTVEVVLNGDVVATTQTDADGFYSVEDLVAGDGYEIRFLHPTSGVVYGTIEADTLPAGGSLDNQNQPIDPSGVVYDAVSRQPVTGAIVNLVDANGNLIPQVCFVDPGQFGQVTGNDGFYRFDIVAGADAACPVGRTEYNIQITAPTGYADPESTVIAAEDGPLNVAGLSDPAAVVPNGNAPQVGQPTTYYLGFLIGSGDANVVNNHIPLDPFTSRAALLVTKTSSTRTASTGDLVPYTITV